MKKQFSSQTCLEKRVHGLDKDRVCSLRPHIEFVLVPRRGVWRGRSSLPVTSGFYPRISANDTRRAFFLTLIAKKSVSSCRSDRKTLLFTGQVNRSFAPTPRAVGLRKQMVAGSARLRMFSGIGSIFEKQSTQRMYWAALSVAPCALIHASAACGVV